MPTLAWSEVYTSTNTSDGFSPGQYAYYLANYGVLIGFLFGSEATQHIMVSTYLVRAFPCLHKTIYHDQQSFRQKAY